MNFNWYLYSLLKWMSLVSELDVTSSSHPNMRYVIYYFILWGNV